MHTPCPVTGQPSTSAEVISAGTYRVAYIPESDCWTTLDQPDAVALESAYQDFDAGQIARANFDAYREQSVKILSAELVQAGLNAADLTGKDFLDYGCGGGHFVAAAGDLGLRATGLELDGESVRLARQRGLDVHSGTLPDDSSPVRGRQFDVVKIMHVLEHVPSPASLVASFHELLKPGGVLIISVPDQESVPSRIKIALRAFGIKRSDYGFVQPPIHLHGFTERSFERLAAHFGFSILSIRRTSPLDNQHFPTVPAYWQGLGAQRAVYTLGKWLGSGGHLTVILKKPA